MDINVIREAVTVSAVVAYLGIVWWAYAPSRKAHWQAKALLDEDEA
jgi:cbb3-type cytochrome oxidase subunit 3